VTGTSQGRELLADALRQHYAAYWAAEMEPALSALLTGLGIGWLRLYVPGHRQRGVGRIQTAVE